MLTIRNLKFVSVPGQTGMILHEDEIFKIPNGLDQNKNTINNNIIQLLFFKYFSDFFPTKIKYLQNIKVLRKHNFGKVRKKVPTSEGHNIC